MDASPEIAAADCEEGSSNGGRDDQAEDWLPNVGVPMTAYCVVLFLKLSRDLDHKSNSETMEWLLRFARPTRGVDRGMWRLLFLPQLVPHFYMLGRDLGHKTDRETLRWILSWVFPNAFTAEELQSLQLHEHLVGD